MFPPINSKCGERPCLLVILALARGMMKKWPPEIKDALDADRLLIITRYADSVTHASEETCFQRNRLMMELADEVVIGYATPGGNLERLCGEYESAAKSTSRRSGLISRW